MSNPPEETDVAVVIEHTINDGGVLELRELAQTHVAGAARVSLPDLVERLDQRRVPAARRDRERQHAAQAHELRFEVPAGAVTPSATGRAGC